MQLTQEQKNKIAALQRICEAVHGRDCPDILSVITSLWLTPIEVKADQLKPLQLKPIKPKGKPA